MIACIAVKRSAHIKIQGQGVKGKVRSNGSHVFCQSSSGCRECTSAMAEPVNSSMTKGSEQNFRARRLEVSVGSFKGKQRT